ncbi:MAG: NAD(+) diphosphatase [Spirochaetaceae bacterium]|nr:NAD(+) diphosphatase [Spirochaetaceae bacterium]
MEPLTGCFSARDRVYIFKKDMLAVPSGFSTADVLEGVPRQLALEAAGNVGFDYFEAPSPDKSSSTACIGLGAGWSARDGWELRTLRSIMLANEGRGSSGTKLSGLIRAAHIMQWRETSVYCGSCGAKNADSKNELARQCPSCGRAEYPRITPAIIAAITNDNDEILLAHNSNFPGRMFSLIAGFNEAGESLEETVHREVKEEVGINIRGLRYAASQPWPFPASLMTGWRARYAGGEIRCDGLEIEEARWFRRDALPSLPGVGSIARYLIDQWLQSTQQ